MKKDDRHDRPVYGKLHSFRKNRAKTFLTLTGILLIAANLRAPITAVGPVIKDIAGQLDLSLVLVGWVMAIPLLSFALLSALVPGAARKLGLERLLFYSLLLLGAGLLIRSAGNMPLLFTGTAFIGAAITVGNVLMPAFIKKEFPARIGLITGIYLVAMNLVSALAAGYSIRVGDYTGMGWKGSIGIWCGFTVIAVAAWLPQIGKRPASYDARRGSEAASQRTGGGMWRSRLAWQISIFMGMQAVGFYCLAAWLPALLQDWGMSPERSGWMFSYLQMAQLPPMLLGPVAAGKMKNQTPLVWVSFILLILGLAGLLIGRTSYSILSVVFIGVSLGLAFTLAMMFLVLRTRQTTEAAELSGMAQTVGYLIAACGPPVFGGLFSIIGNWYLSLVLLVLAGIALLVTGLASAKYRFVRFRDQQHEEKE